MSWARGDDKHGRDVGYAIDAKCDEPGCEEKINRGLSFVCGGEPNGGAFACGYHFCEKHRHYVDVIDSSESTGYRSISVCAKCKKELEEAKQIYDEDAEESIMGGGQ